MVVAERAVGVQTPRLSSVPVSVSSRADEVLELGRSCGLTADPWQQLVVESMFGFREDGLFSAMRVGVNVPRQNGKGTILELRELGGIFVLGEKLVTHTSQMQDTSLEAMRRLVEALEEGDLVKELKARGGVQTGNGKEALNFRSGQRIRFRTRSKTSARGWAGQVVVFDEAMFISAAGHNAAFPIIAAQPNPQVIYAGSAADQEVHDHAVIWARLREQGLAGDQERLAWFEWSMPFEHPSEMPDRLDMDLVRIANPAFGIRITEDYIREEYQALGGRGYATERGGVGDWPRTDMVEQDELSGEAWAGLVDEASQVRDYGLCVGFDVSPERWSAVSVAGRRDDELVHLETVESKAGTSWLPGYLARFVAKHRPVRVVCAGKGPVASVAAAVEAAGVQFDQLSEDEHAQACGQLVDLVRERGLRHLGQESLKTAISGAAIRPYGDAWLWSRKSSRVNIAPLVSGTLALSAALAEDDGDLAVY